MTCHTLKREQVLPHPRRQVFAFFLSPGNLPAITPPWLRLTILTPAPIRMHCGTVIDYTVRPFGVPLHWRTLITTYVRDSCFVDEQISGPFSYWHHRHEFVESGDETVMKDTVTYALPCGPLGTLVHPLLVRRQLVAIFGYRAGVIPALLAEGVGKPPESTIRRSRS